MRRWIYRLLFSLILVIFIYSGYKSITLLLEERHNNSLMAQAQGLYNADESSLEPSTNIDIVDSQIQGAEYRNAFTELKLLNDEIVGWITISGTNVDYPVLRAADNDFYLTHNYQKEAYAPGSIFMDYRNTSELTDRNTIIYGHSMRNQSMFGQLNQYLDYEFFNAHRQFSYDSQILSYEVQIFAVYETTIDNYYIQTDFTDDNEFLSYLKTAQDNSIYKSDIELNADMHIITLSTCDKAYATDGRVVIQGILVPKS